jgi:2,5-diamino-6-(ribosylamino)-4(3H)-pyrimidinone 5'-phosphate reductase
MLPYVILYNAVSVDGRIDWFPADVGKFYELAAIWKENATLAGSDTLLKAYREEQMTPANEEAFEHQKANSTDTRPLLVVPDSRGRLRPILHLLHHEPYWRDNVILVSKSTPEAYLKYLQKRHIPFITAGDDHVDYKTALEELNASYSVKVVRVDSGGTLNGILLRAGLVNEVSVLIHPYLVGGTSPRSMYRAPDLIAANGAVHLKLISLEQLPGDLIRIRYGVTT